MIFSEAPTRSQANRAAVRLRSPVRRHATTRRPCPRTNEIGEDGDSPRVFSSTPLQARATTGNPRNWRGGRVVEGAPLLREYTGDRIEGSNPFLSAIDEFTNLYNHLAGSLCSSWAQIWAARRASSLCDWRSVTATRLVFEFRIPVRSTCDSATRLREPGSDLLGVLDFDPMRRSRSLSARYWESSV